MAKYNTQRHSKKAKGQPMISDSDEEYDEHTHNEMLTGSDSSDDVVDDVLPTQTRRQPAKDIAALAAAAQQQAAAFAARQKKHATAAAATAAGQDIGAAVVGESSEEDLEDEVDSSDAEEEQQQGGTAAAQRPHIYDTDGLHEKLEDVAWIEEQPWRESLVITSAQPTHVEDVDDDLERELAFYNQALSATTEAIARYQGEDVAWLRPPDYYAEMVKTDEQMARIKDRLMHEQQQIDQASERRKAREQKAYAKQVQAEKQKERTQEKKRQIQQVQQLRKQREKSGFAGELDFDAEMNKQGSRSGGQQQQQQRKGMRPGQRFNPNDRTPNKKRQLKNAKFGFGGKKRLQKQNDAFSAADMSGYKAGRSSNGTSKQGGKGAWGRAGRPQGGVQKKKGGVTRPGKARRQQQRQRKV